MAKKIMKKAQMGAMVKNVKDKYNSFVKKGEDDKNFTRKNFKTADSLRNARVPFGKDQVKKSESNRAKADSIEKAVEKRVGVKRSANLYEQKNGGKTAKKK